MSVLEMSHACHGSEYVCRAVIFRGPMERIFRS